MTSLSRRGLIGALAAAAPAQAQPVAPGAPAPGWRPPPAEQRCPSRWGAADRRGSMNLMTPERTVRAARLIRSGEMVELAHVLSGDIPFFGPRRFDVHLKRTQVAPGANRRGSNEELVITELGQVGTQLDALPHQTIGDETYNCVPMSGIARRDGFTAMGAEHFTTVMTRGVLLDIAALKGVPMLPVDYEITVADLEAALARAGLALERGDAIIINTGWHRHWGRDNAAYVGDSPGIGVAAAEWLVRQDPLLVGADNSSVEVSPNPDRSVSLPVHQIMLVVNGVLLVENLKLDELAARRATEFAFVMQPLKIKGGTGSTVAPTAMF